MTPKKILESLPELLPCLLEPSGIGGFPLHSSGPCWLSSLSSADSSMGRNVMKAVQLSRLGGGGVAVLGGTSSLEARSTYLSSK